MTSERWQQIERLYHSALECEKSERAAFLKEASAGDEALRREVESLLAHQDRAESFMEAPALEAAAKRLAQDQVHAAVGGMVGPYEIVSLLGAGGMGKVYRARDTKLNRPVALKVLPAEVASDQDRIERFLREARAASTINHPNVAHIYEIGEADGVSFIAMEYAEGQTLAGRINGRPLDSAEIVEIALQIADALDEAHSKGITHRDIKPANIILTPRGQVKVLDFGLAKIARPESQGDGSTASQTEPGLVMGTAAYMSPEQALGKEVDPRSDTFSLGTVLYEMATGRQPFSGSNPSETIDKIIHAQPEAIARFNYNVPAELERVIRKCLEKDRERRYQSARELLVDLKNLKRDSDSDVVPASGWQTRVTPRRTLRNALVAAVPIALLAAFAIWIYFGVMPRRAIDSVAILPFVNVTADPNVEYLSDGITESLINNLSQLPNLTVMSRNSVFRYKAKETDAQAAGRELKVQAVLTGRVVQRGDDLLISAELIDVRNNSQLWGEQYHPKLAAILAVQADISKEISEKLRLRLTGKEKERLTKRYTDNSEAYQLYLKGRYYWNKRTEETLTKGIEYFEQAIEKDPGYALAYTGLADSYTTLGFSFDGHVLPPREVLPKAKKAATKALEIDDTLAEAHTSLAMVKFLYDWEWPTAEREFKRAIELNPSYSNAHHWYSHYLISMGRIEESLTESKRALDFDPLNSIINVHLGWHYLYARQYDQAIEQFRKTIEMDPNYGHAHWYLGLAYQQKGMYREATAELQRARGLFRRNTEIEMDLGHTYAVWGKRSEAQQVLKELHELSKRRFVSSYGIATIYAGLGEENQAFEWLEKAYQERSDLMPHLKVDPRVDSLRYDPRFTDLLRRVGLPP